MVSKGWKFFDRMFSLCELWLLILNFGYARGLIRMGLVELGFFDEKVILRNIFFDIC